MQDTNGREYCKKNNPEFKQAHNDLMNLVPAIGEVNGDRVNYGFTMIDSEERKYGANAFKVYKNNETGVKLVDAQQNDRGDIARVHLYMQDKYGLEFSDEIFYLIKYWNEIDPISGWGKERIRRIEDIQGELLNK